MKIVYVYDAIVLVGGIERIWCNKMNYLADKYGYEVYLITAMQGTHPFSFPLSPKVKHIDLNVKIYIQYRHRFPMNLWLKWKLNRIYNQRLKEQLQKIDPDIIIGAPHWKAELICNLRCRSKKIIESHQSHIKAINTRDHNESLLHVFIKKLLAWKTFRTIERKSDRIVILTKGDGTEWKNKSKIRIIPNMILPVSGSASSCTTHRVISAGRLEVQKGYDRLITAWESIHAKYPDWKLDIYGEGTLRNVLQDQIETTGLSHSITIHPPTQTLFEEFKKSSVFVLSSRYEGFGLVLAEAMACGIPCISFDCSYGPSDLIKDGEDGILVPEGNIPMLAQSICRLIKEEELRKQYGKAARKNIERFFPENIMCKWDELFKEILTK